MSVMVLDRLYRLMFQAEKTYETLLIEVYGANGYARYCFRHDDERLNVAAKRMQSAFDAWEQVYREASR